MDSAATRPTVNQPVADQAARDRIISDLDTNMLVEAGAGSGKTTALVGRMLALVIRGEPVESIAAVTFTRKSAHELRERFQLRLEAELRTGDPASVSWRRCERALHDLDRAFLGTIHSFCARILREHPLEAALDPNFSEVTEDGWEQLLSHFWSRWLERCKQHSDPTLAELAAVGVDPASLYNGFRVVTKYQDIDFPLPASPEPDAAPCRASLEALLARAQSLMPAEESVHGGDRLMDLVRRLQYQRRAADWTTIVGFCAALDTITRADCGVTQKCWSDVADAKKQAKALGEDFLAMLDGEIAALLTCWREHRYPLVMRTLRRAAQDFARERHDTGQLGFEDLLMLSAQLLRDRPHVRDSLGARYRHLLVDEFQDTDPIQAEVCFLLASDSREGNDWRAVAPRAGGLFLVGDPKQSIYRFRRADIQVYDLAKARMNECGVVLALTVNFRSVRAIGEFVNGYFAGQFPAAATDMQASFSPMQTVNENGPMDGVTQYWVRPDGRSSGSILNAESEQLASWIAQRLADGGCTPGDFLILTRARDPLVYHARALGARNIPVTTSGARLPQEYELTELLVVLQAIADPDNRILVAAALEGLFFGCSPADLYDASADGMELRITHPPLMPESVTGRALLQLHAWWRISQQQPADVLLERILGDTGLLVFAASQALGDARAGALLRLVEVLRTESMTAASGVAGAMDRITLLLGEDSDDAPLRPGRADAVRVMNLHKAKGLEARIVVLAAPVPESDHPVREHIVRSRAGAATGGLVIPGEKGVIAQPAGWLEMAAAEEQFAEAEAQRLLYVAATRAMSELVVARCELPRAKTASANPQDTSFWSAFGDALTTLDRETVMLPSAAPGRRSTDRTSLNMSDAIDSARARLKRASETTMVRHTVTESARMEREESVSYELPLAKNRGKAWGRAIHRCIEAAGHGRAGAALSAFIAAVAREEELQEDQCAEIQKALDEIMESELWKELTGNGSASFELPVMSIHDEDGRANLIEGVIDAAALTDDGWLVVDWKTDAAGPEEWARRSGKYEKQVAAYEQILGALSGKATRSALHRVQSASDVN